MKILVKFPSRERPARFFASLETVYNLAYDAENIYVLGTFDENDTEGMNNPYVKGRLNELESIGRFKAVFGESKSKIHAVNKDMDLIPELFPQAADWDILVNLSDDMLFIAPNWDEYIRAEMRIGFPDTDGYLHFYEQDSKSALCVMTIVGRKYYERFGFIYHPDYASLFCDNEQMQVAKLLNRYKYVDLEIFKHYNPAYNYENMPKDELFLRQQEIGYSIDEQTYNRRKALKFEIYKWI
jgi:hypothetical protein